MSTCGSSATSTASSRSSHLLRPGPEIGWSVTLGDLRVHRAHVAYDTGRERVNLDGVELRGSADLPFERPLRASVALTGRWRERAVPIEVDASVRAGGGTVSIEHASVLAGGVSAAAQDLRIAGAATPGGAPSIVGMIRVDAPRAEVARLVPGLELPADLSVRVEAVRVPASPWTRVRISGRVGDAPVTALVRADLAARRAVGFVATGALDAGALSRGRIEGGGSVFASFDLALPGAAAPPGAALPVGNAMVHAWGTLEGVPEADVRVALASTGERVSTIVDAVGPALRASVAAELSKRGAAVTLHRGTLTASTGDLERASGGTAPVHGTLRAALTASGALAPRPSLAVAGTVDGRGLRFRDLSIATLALALDARRLPERPLGRAELTAEGVARGRMYLAELAITAADRADGKLAVAVRTRPRQEPWLIEADALVTPGDVVAVDLVRHHVRAGGGADWRGDSGHLEIAPDRIELRDLASGGAAGSLRLAGVYHRAGRRAGDLEARARAAGFALANVDPRYRGTADAELDVARRGGRIVARADVTGRGVALEPSAPPVDGRVRLDARGGRLAADGEAGAPRLGRARFAVDVAAPRDLADAAAWRALGRGAIRTGRLALEDLDVARVAALAHLGGGYAGRVGGDLQLSATAIDGTVAVRDLVIPALDRFGPVQAELRLSQAAPDELTPVLAARLQGIGPIEARATLALPDRVLDPAAWRRLGRAALAGATIRASEIEIDPALLARFGVAAELRGSAAVSAELAGGGRGARLDLRVRQLRGRPLVAPVDVQLTASIDGAATRVRLAAGARGTRLLELEGGAPITPAMLEADPRAALRAPLSATVTMPDVPAVRLATVFGRGDVIGGTIASTATFGGTVGVPTLRARVAGTDLQVTPGPGGRPIKTLERLALDARWDGAAGELSLDGLQRGGTLRVVAAGSPRALGRATLTVRATQFDLAPLLAFLPGPAGAGAGRLDADLAVTGLEPRTAKLAGELHVVDARLPVAPTVGTLRGAKLDLVAGARELRLRLDGRLGDGTVAAAGTVALAGAAPTGGALALTLRGVSPIGAVEPRIDADVTANVRKTADRWIADVAVRNGYVRVPSGRGEELKPVGAPPDMVFVAGERLAARPRRQRPPSRPVIELRVALAPTRLESEELRGVISGRVAITADTGGVGMVGAIQAERADLDLFGRRYLVERAAVRFDGPTDPLLDLRISHDFPEVTTITTVRGRLSTPELIMTSEPAIYSQGQLLGFLLGGEPGGEPSSGNPRDKVTAAGASFVANRIGGYIKRALPIDLDVLRYESATASSSAAVTVGTWLTDSLFLAYRRRLAARPDENAGEAEAEYWVTRRVMVEGVLGDRGISGVDLLWRKRY